jgi:alkane 1-monooxygenase
MTPLRYLTPFAFLALVPLGAYLGGAWTFMAAAATPLCLAGLDAALGDDAPLAEPANGRMPRWLPRIYIVLQLAAIVLAAAWVAQTSTSLAAAAGLALSLAVTTGVFGIVAAHEMIHSRSAGERALGLALLGSIFYMHFRIAHVYGHHRRAATFEDPASARMGEGLYAFLARSITGQFREAWVYEARRRRRAGRAAIGPGNRMVAYIAIEASLLFAIGLVSGRALVFLFAIALVAVSLLESFNYVAHYGLSRCVSVQGRPEPLGPEHSWNSAKRMNNAALFNMGRHSDHHRRTTRRYAQLEKVRGAAELPSGYAAALLTALIPPLWRRVMDPRATAVMAGRSADRKLQAGTP